MYVLQGSWRSVVRALSRIHVQSDTARRFIKSFILSHRHLSCPLPRRQNECPKFPATLWVSSARFYCVFPFGVDMLITSSPRDLTSAPTLTTSTSPKQRRLPRSPSPKQTLPLGTAPSARKISGIVSKRHYGSRNMTCSECA